MPQVFKLNVKSLEMIVPFIFIRAGGVVQSLRWDPSGSRVAATFADSALVAVFAAAVSGAALSSLTPVG